MDFCDILHLLNDRARFSTRLLETGDARVNTLLAVSQLLSLFSDHNGNGVGAHWKQEKIKNREEQGVLLPGLQYEQRSSERQTLSHLRSDEQPAQTWPHCLPSTSGQVKNTKVQRN